MSPSFSNWKTLTRDETRHGTNVMEQRRGGNVRVFHTFRYQSSNETLVKHFQQIPCFMRHVSFMTMRNEDSFVACNVSTRIRHIPRGSFQREYIPRESQSFTSHLTILMRNLELSNFGVIRSLFQVSFTNFNNSSTSCHTSHVQIFNSHMRFSFSFSEFSHHFHQHKEDS